MSVMKQQLMISVLLLSSFGSRALTIDLTVGSAETFKVDIENTLDSILKLSGYANAKDLKILSNMSDNVRCLDLSDLTIVSSVNSGSNELRKEQYADGEIPEHLITGKKLKELILPTGLVSVGTGAFAGTEIESIEIPEKVTEIGDNAFTGCYNLRKVTINSNPLLGKGVFAKCISLTDVSFSVNPVIIPESCFVGCISYTQPLPPTVREIGSFAFLGTGIKNLNLHQVTRIGDFAFAEMKDLESVSFSVNTDISMGKGVFYGDTGIEVLPNIICNLPRLTLAQTYGKLHNVINAPQIGKAAFANNPNIDTITLGGEVREIEAHAFRNLSGLKLIDVRPLGSSIPDVDEDSFSGLKNHDDRYDIKLSVTTDSKQLWAEHPVWGLFDIGHFDTGIESASSDNDINISREGTSLFIWSSGRIDHVSVYSIKGISLIEVSPEATEVTIADIPAEEMMVVKIESGNTVKVIKCR